VVRGVQCQCSLLKLDGLIQVRQDTHPLESESKADGKVVERRGPITMMRGVQHQCSSLKLNGFNQVS
jgi:hypothetical protein